MAADAARGARSGKVLGFLRHFLRFGLVGAVVAGIQSGGYILLVDLGWSGPLLANFIAFWPATVVAFAVHYSWTFRSARRPWRAAWRFTATKLLGLGLNTGGVWLVTDRLGLSHYYALPVMLLVTPLTVFSISKVWAFQDPRRYGGDRAGQKNST